MGAFRNEPTFYLGLAGRARLYAPALPKYGEFSLT
jgi:hypothetical protein